MKLALGQEVYEILYKFLHKCDVWSSALVHRLAFWTSACLPSASKSIPQLFLAPFGLPPASPPLQSPIRSSFSPLLDFRASPHYLKVQSAALSRSFWTFSCLPSTSKSNLPLFLAPFGLPHISLLLKVQSAALARSFWTSSCLPSTSKSNPPLFLAPFGLPPASPPPQSPILRYFSLLLDFLLPPLRLKVHSATLPLPTTQKRRIAKQSASRNPPVSINHSNPPSANSTK